MVHLYLCWLTYSLQQILIDTFVTKGLKRCPIETALASAGRTTEYDKFLRVALGERC